MNKLVVIGELLVDFIEESENLFKLNPGGAPANVASCVKKLGGEALVISRVGDDLLGRYLLDELKKQNLNTDYVQLDKKHNTSLAFIKNGQGGERTFSFFRKQTADLFFTKDEMIDIFKKNDILHFGSVDLITETNRESHKKIIDYATSKDCIVSFDPNLRFNLWDDLDKYKRVINDFIPYAHILKISDDELSFINGDNSIFDLFRGNVKVIIITKGNKGAILFTKTKEFEIDAKKVISVDTTGAGDSFIGAFIYQLLRKNISSRNILNYQDYFPSFLDFATKVAAYVCTKKGSLKIMPTLDEIN